MQLEAPPVTKFKKPSWRTIANLYREGLIHVFGGDPENPDEYRPMSNPASPLMTTNCSAPSPA